MDFRSMNKFNVLVNALSGNFFPVSEKKTNIGFGGNLHLIFIILMEIAYLSTATIGLVFFSPILQSFQSGAAAATIIFEVIAMTIYMNSQREYLRNLISKIDGIITESDELRKHVRDTTKPYNERLKICTIVAVIIGFGWSSIPLVNLVENKSFTYSDFTLPAYFTEAPFDVKVFVAGVFVQTVGNFYVLLKKCAMDVYLCYLVTIMTAEYKYIREQLAKAFRQDDYEGDDISVIEKLRKYLQHHTIVIETSRMLSALLSINIGVIYISCILRFCFLAYTFVISDTYLKKLVYAVYTTGNFIQVYICCLCIHELFEASTSIIDDAFYENWYGRGRRVMNIFRTIGLGNEIECRLTAFRIVDLSVPTFVTIVNKAYSVCLLVLRIN